MTNDSPTSMISSPRIGSNDPKAESEPNSRTNHIHSSPTEDIDLDDADVRDQGESLTPESLGKRILEPKTILSFLFAILVMVFTVRSLDISPGEVWAYIREANVGFFALAVVAFYGSFVVRAFRWRGMLSRAGINAEHGYDVPKIPGVLKILLLSWFANCVVPAKLGDAFRGFLFKERTGASFGVSMGTILAERLMDLVVLVMVLMASGFVVFGTHIPSQAEYAFLLGSGTVLIGVIGVVVLWFARERVERLLPERFTLHFQKLSTGIFHSLRRPAPLVGLSILVWSLDGIRLYLVAKSLGIDVSGPESLLVSLSSALVTVVPFTPGGLGIVDAFMIWILGQIDVQQNAATAIAFLDRLISYWSLILIGLPLYLFHLRHTIAKREV